MNTSDLPYWVAPFCCATPFCALLAFSVSPAFGATISTPGLICLILLCGRITGWVLNRPNRLLLNRIENRK